MSDLIKQQDAIDAVKTDWNYSNDQIRAINRIPSAQKTGEWIDKHKCSNCGFSDVRMPKYCCRCGSMNGGE